MGILNSIPQGNQCVIGSLIDETPSLKTMGGTISVPTSKIVSASFKHGSLALVEKKQTVTAEDKINEEVENAK